jgi:hypothetical protein
LIVARMPGTAKKRSVIFAARPKVGDGLNKDDRIESAIPPRIARLAEQETGLEQSETDVVFEMT